MLRKLLIALAVLAVVGCSSKPDVSKLKEGMSESEIVAVLGTPDKAEDVPMMGAKSLNYTQFDPPIMIMLVEGKAKLGVSGNEVLFGTPVQK